LVNVLQPTLQFCLSLATFCNPYLDSIHSY